MSSQYAAFPIAKLQPRAAATRLIPRPRLEQQLDQAIQQRLVLIAAPPGYGKTTLLASWLRRFGPAAYCRLDRSDKNADALLATLCASLGSAYHLQLPSTEEAKADLALGYYLAALHPLVTAIERRPERFVLLLDEYQHLADHDAPNNSGLQLLEALLRLAPPNLCIVLAGWGNLPLPEVANALIGGSLVRFGASDLAYSPDELATLLAAAVPGRSDLLQSIYTATAGWPAAVEAVFARLDEIGAAPSSEQLEPLLEQTAAALSSWLARTLLSNLPVEQVHFLQQAAILPFLQSGLCDHALQRSDSALQLHELAEAGLLAWQMWQPSPQGVIMRYGLHPLFRRAIAMQEADPSLAQRIIARAGDWLVRHEEWAVAAELFLDAGMTDQAAAVLEQATIALLPAPLTPQLVALARRLPSALSTRLLAPPLEVRTLGRFQVSRNGVPISDAEWRRTKVKSLLKLLIANYGTRLSRDMILEALWEHLPPDAALNNFNATLSALRHVLEPGLSQGRASQYIIYQDGYCWVSTTANLWIDVVAFERLLEEARSRRRDEARSRSGTAALNQQVGWLLEQAVELYNGEFLPADIYEDWPISKRERTRERYLDALITLAYAARERGDLEQAVEYAQQVVATESFRESVHLLLMELYARLGKRDAALRQYQICAKALQTEFGTEPSAQTLKLYNIISASRRVEPGTISAVLGAEL